MLEQMAAEAELEAGFIRERAHKALAKARRPDLKLGTPGNLKRRDVGSSKGRATRILRAATRAADLAPIIADVKAAGASSLRQIAAGLNERGIRAPRGGAWSAVQVKRTLERIGA